MRPHSLGALSSIMLHCLSSYCAPSSVLSTDVSAFITKMECLLQATVRTGLPLATWARAAPGGDYELFVPSGGVTAICCAGEGGEEGPSELCGPFPQDELEHSLGESAAQGAAGVVLWVSWENTKTKVSSGPGWGLGWGQELGWEADWEDPGRPFLSLHSWRASR